MKKNFTLLILLLKTVFASADSWQPMGPTDSFQIASTPTAYIACKLNATNVPYIAFQDNNNSNKITVRKFDGISWSTVGIEGFSAGAASYISMAIDGSGIPYVAYRDAANANKATVQKFNGTSWVLVGTAGFSAGTAQYLSLALDASGTLYAAYEDASVSNKITVSKFNGTSWSVVGTSGFSAGAAQYVSLAISSGGTPYVVYEDGGTSNKATVKKFDGTSWVTVGTAGISGGVAQYTSIAIDNAGTPYIAYQDQSASSKVTVRKFDGTSWTTVGTAGFSAGFSTYISIAVDLNNVPYVGYAEGTTTAIAVKKFDGISWITLPGQSAASAVAYTNICMDANNIPFLAFTDYDNGNRPCLRKYNGSSWTNLYSMGINERRTDYTTVTIDPFGTPYMAYTDSGNAITVRKYNDTSWVLVGNPRFSIGDAADISITTDKNGTPYVAYQEKGTNFTQQIIVKKFNGTSWVTVGPSAFSVDAGYYTSIAIDSAGTLYVAYQETGTNYDYQAVVRKFDGTNWVYVGPKVSSDGAGLMKMALDKKGTPYVAYVDVGPAYTSLLAVKKFNGTAWVSVGAANISAATAGNVDIALDTNGLPYVAYYEQNPDFTFNIRVKKYDGALWLGVGGGKLPGTISTSTYIGLIVDKHNIPYVAYPDSVLGYKIAVRKYDSSSWLPVGVLPVSVGQSKHVHLAGNERKMVVAYLAGDDYHSGGVFAKKFMFPYCDTVINLAVTDITTGGAIIQWDSIFNSMGYEYVLDQTPTIPTSGTSITDTTYKAHGLVANTTYYFHIRTNCGVSNSSSWVTVQFKTLTCDTPINLAASNITTNSADISWTAIPGALDYEYAVDQSLSAPTSLPGNFITTNTYTTTGLAPNTTYYFHLLTHCDSVNASNWITKAFTTLPLEIHDSKKENTRIYAYPNPAKNVINIRIEDGSKNGYLKLIAVNGKIIKEVTVDKSDMQFQVSDVTPGIYWLKYIDDRQTKIISLEKL